MKAYISVDLEGCNGINHSSQTQPNEPGYNRALKILHDETNAVIEGLLAGGATEIMVNDSHWDARNLHIEEMFNHKAVSVVSGWQKPFSMVSQINSDERADFAVFLGYHTRAGHATGVLSHTYRAQIFFEVRLNGKPVGETGLNAALAGHFGVPIAMLTGDDQVIQEAKSFLPNIATAQVKTAVSRYAAIFPNYQDTLQNLKETATRAAKDKKHRDLFKPGTPASIDITMFDPSMADAAELLPGVQRVSARDISIKHEDYSVAFRLMLAVGALGASRRDPYFS